MEKSKRGWEIEKENHKIQHAKLTSMTITENVINEVNWLCKSFENSVGEWVSEQINGKFYRKQ